MEDDSEFPGAGSQDPSFVDAVLAAIDKPQDLALGPDPDWRTAVGDFALQQPSIGVLSHQLLQLQEAVVGQVPIEEGQPAPGLVGDRVGRLIFWGLEMEARRLAKELDEAARRDKLTGLLNRRAFDDDVSRARERGVDLLTVAVIDVDGLKKVNDEQGHESGDELLRSVGRQISKLADAGVTAYRWGGDEFALLAIDTEAGAFGASVRHSQQASEAPFSAGLASQPGDSDEWEEVLRLADERMYEDKRERGQGRR